MLSMGAGRRAGGMGFGWECGWQSSLLDIFNWNYSIDKLNFKDIIVYGFVVYYF